MNNIQRFIDSIDVPNTEKVVRSVLGSIEIDIDLLCKNELESLILNLQPGSPKAITTICYVLGSYAKWLQREGLESGALLAEIQSVDKAALWKKAKPNAKKKFISYGRFQEILHEIELYEEFNPLYYSTLFRCVFEGVYNDDLSVIKNLRPSDICGTTLTLHEDNGHTYKLKVSAALTNALNELSTISVWERRNRYGVCRIDMKGSSFDSIFKVEYRKTKKISEEGSYKFSYYSKLRKISDEYVEYKILPLQLFVSGIMHRIGMELKKNNITLQEAFADHSRNKLAHEIISKELIRCNYETDVGNFREMVKGHLDSFV